MRYHREIPKKPSGKDLLAKPRAILDTTRLREMADLAHHLGFESSEITALKQFPKSANPPILRGNEKPALVTDGPGEIRKDRCGLPYAQNYEEDRKYLFITHLHDDRYEQSEGITSYFRLRSTYLKFYGMPDDFNPQQNLITATGDLLSPAFRLTQSACSPRDDPIRGVEHMEVDGEQTEDTMMQEGEGEGEEQGPPFQAEDALTQEPTMQQQKLLFEAAVLEKKKYEQEQYRQKLNGDANALVAEEQRLGQKRQKLVSDASALTKQEQEQGQRRQKLLSHTNILEKQEQGQEQYRQRLIRDASVFEEEDQEKEQQRQKLLSNASTLKQEQEQEQRRQRLARNAVAVREQEQEQAQEQERRRRKLISDASALKESEQEHEQMYQQLIGHASTLREQEQKREEQHQTLEREEKEQFTRKQRQEEQRQTLAADASELNLQQRKQEERRSALAAVADELVKQEQRQKEQRQKLAEYASDLGKQGLRQNEQQKKLTADISELHKQEKRYKELRRDRLKQKREQKSVEPKILESVLHESETILERDERDMGDLQRQGQEELADLESSSPLELEYGGIDADQNVPEVQAQNYSMDAVQTGGTQLSVSAPPGESSPAQEHGTQQDRAQVKGQEERLTGEAHETEAQERGQECGVQERGHEHQKQESEQEDKAHGDAVHEDGSHRNVAYKDAAHNDKVLGGSQADEGQEAVQEDKEHKEEQDGGANRARKRRVMSEESDDSAALRAQQVREGRKPVEKGKYQRLNRFGSSNHDMNPEGDMSMDGTGEEDTTPMQRKKAQPPRRQQRQELQIPERTKHVTAATVVENGEQLNGFCF